MNILKSIIYKFLLFALLITFFSCSKEENFNTEVSFGEEASVETTEIDTQDIVYQKILGMGFSPNKIEGYDDYYLVEGDISFPKDISFYGDEKEVNVDKSGINERHAHTDNLVYLTNLKIDVYIDPSMPSAGVDNWRTAISSALNDWNSISNFGVHFVLTSYPSSSGITITSDNGALANNFIADALFPSITGRPGNRIRVNLNNFSGLSESQRRRNIVHELGHCIGFRHTNWETNDGGSTTYGANLIPGTPSVDNGSVMNGSTGSYSWNGFSYYDLVASRFLYPYALKWSSVNVSEESEQDGWSSDDDIYLNVYTDASYMSLTILPTGKTLSYYDVTDRTAPNNFISKYSQQKTLSAGSTQYYITSVRSECWYDYGDPQNCYSEYLEFISLN